MKKLRVGIEFTICMLMVFCSAGAPAQNYPQRIISLGPAVTEKLYLLGVEDKLIGCTVYCKRPREAERKEKIGTVTEVNLEKIVSLEPDLVLATALTNLNAIKKLRNLRIRVVRFPSPRNFIQLCQQFLELGKIVNRKKEAKEIVNDAKKKLKSIKKIIGELKKPKVFVQIGARPLFTVTRDSFVHDFIKFAGGINIAAGAKSGLYSREKVLKSNPDVIIITTMGIVGEREKGIWQKYKTINAVKNNRIYIIDAYKLCSPTPLSFVETLKETVEILHPQLTEKEERTDE